MKRLMTMLVMVVVVLASSPAEAQPTCRRDSARYIGHDYRPHGFRIRIGGCRERYPSDRYRRGRYGYRYGPVYDRYEYKSEGPYHKYHVHDRRSGGIVTGLVEALFGKREMDITEEVKNPYEKQQENEELRKKVEELKLKLEAIELQKKIEQAKK